MMRIVFMGTPQAAVPSLRRCLQDGHDIAVVYTQPDRPSGRGNKINFSPVKAVALECGIEVLQPLKVKTSEAAETFRSHQADVAVVVAYGRILPQAFLSAYAFGAVNVHFSLLPKYRGAAPVNRAIANGENESGVTTIKMDSGLDTGDILLQEITQIGADETAIDLMTRLSQLGADLLSRTLSDLAAIKSTVQDHDAATFAPLMTRLDGLIDWNEPAKVISDRVRGFQPFPSAHTQFRSLRITLWNAFEMSTFEKNATRPGEIVDARGDILVVSAGNGTFLRIDELQCEGKRRMTVRDFVNGLKPRVGEMFGV